MGFRRYSTSHSARSTVEVDFFEPRDNAEGQMFLNSLLSEASCMEGLFVLFLDHQVTATSWPAHSAVLD